MFIKLPTEAPPYELTRRITRLAFRQRLTQAERIAMDLAGESPIYRDDEHPEETRAQFQTRRANAAAFRDLNQQVSEATYIDLDRADTRAGVQLLETVGILGSGRALEILDNPILDGERPL